MANHQNEIRSDHDAVQFYLGTAACMMFFWQLSFALGFAFGNFAPESLALDFAVPLSFVALLIPAIKKKSYVFVAILSASLSLLLHDMPFRSGLITSACLAIAAAWFIIKRSRA
jgi:predicted branched-subunit amino acid permease